MDVERAAQELDYKLRIHPWYLCTGIGQTAQRPTLFVYVKLARGSSFPRIQKDWRGFNVVVRRAQGLRAGAQY